MDATPGLWYSPAKVGDFVARGPWWPLGNVTDGGPGGLGTITELAKSDNTVSGEVKGKRCRGVAGSVAARRKLEGWVHLKCTGVNLFTFKGGGVGAPVGRSAI